MSPVTTADQYHSSDQFLFHSSGVLKKKKKKKVLLADFSVCSVLHLTGGISKVVFANKCCMNQHDRSFLTDGQLVRGPPLCSRLASADSPSLQRRFRLPLEKERKRALGNIRGDLRLRRQHSCWTQQGSSWERQQIVEMTFRSCRSKTLNIKPWSHRQINLGNRRPLRHGP